MRASRAVTFVTTAVLRVRDTLDRGIFQSERSRAFESGREDLVLEGVSARSMEEPLKQRHG